MERIPLIPKALEFVGLLYTSTFFYKWVTCNELLQAGSSSLAITGLHFVRKDLQLLAENVNMLSDRDVSFEMHCCGGSAMKQCSIDWISCAITMMPVSKRVCLRYTTLLHVPGWLNNFKS